MKIYLITFILSLVILTTFTNCEYGIEIDSTPPVVSIQSPISGAKVSEIVKIIVSANDNEGIEKVEFFIDDSLYYSDFQEPYEYSWNTCLYDDNSEHNVKVKAYDESENFTISQPILLIVDNFLSYPNPIRIDSIMFENGKFKIIWSKSTDTDFMSYKLEKSLHNTMEDYDVIYMTNEIKDTVFIDIDANPVIFQYYRISVSDTIGLITIGQIKSSSLDPAPHPVNILSVTYSLDKMVVEWEESFDSDFKNYKLLYSFTKNGNKDTIVTYFDRSVKSYTLTEFDPTHENWFWVSVTDTLGQSTIGTGLTNLIENPPLPSFLYNITYNNNSFFIKWSKNKENDFLSYTLYQSFSENMGGEKVIFTTTNKDYTKFTVEGVEYNELRYYRVVVTDLWELQTSSIISSGSSYPKIAYSSFIQGHGDIFLMEFNGSIQTNLTNTNIDDIEPIFSPDGEKILFRSFHGRDDYELYIMNIDGSDLIRLTYNNGDDRDHDFSHDCTQIVFASRRNDTHGIYKMNIDGSSIRCLKNNWSIGEPQFSPDGTKIVFRFFEGDAFNSNSEIYIMDSDGGNMKNLSNRTEIDHLPKFSPDGLKILFLSTNVNSIDDIYIMNSDGSNQINLTNNEYGAWDPEFSPDGSKIVYIGRNSSHLSNVYIMNTDGSDKTNISNCVGTDKEPKFLQDGSKIIFSSRRPDVSDYYDIYMMNLDGSNLKRLTEGVDDKFPQFQPRQ